MKSYTLQTVMLLLATVSVTGCAVHRARKVEPPVQPPAAFLSATSDTAASCAQGRWWRAFNDPALDAVIDTALAANYSLAQAVARLEQADAARRGARSARLPSLSAGGRTTRNKQASIYGNYLSKTAGMSATAAWELDLWRKLANAHAAGSLDAQASRGDLESLYMTIAANTADLYYLVAEQREQLALTERTIESFERLTGLVRRRYELGLVGALDIYQARQNLAAARVRKPLIEAELAVAEHALSILLGRYPGPMEDAVVVALPEIPAAFPAGLPSELLARRPDVRAALLRVMAADARVGQAVAARFPSINLTGSYGRSYSDFGGGFGNFGRAVFTADFWNLTSDLLMPLFDGGRRRAEADRARAACRERLAAYNETVLTAFGEVEDALVRNHTTEQRIRHLQERAEATGAALRLAVDNYAKGLSDYLPVLTGQSADFESRSQLVAARRQLISYRISLARALGGLWMADAADNRLSAKSAREKVDE